MVLALYRTADGEITPFILIDAECSLVSSPTMRLHLYSCLAEAQWPPRVSGETVRSPCTLFALNKDSGMRLYLASPLNEQCSIHSENCFTSRNFPRNFPGYLSPNTYKYLVDRSRVCCFLQRIARDNSFDPKFTPGWANAVHISGSNAKPYLQRLSEQPWVLDYHKGIQETREYLKTGFEKEKLLRKTGPLYLRFFLQQDLGGRLRLLKRTMQDALWGDGANENTAEMEDIPPTTSRV